MLAAVCCQGADELALVDPAADDPAGRVPVGGHPVHAAAVSGRVFVATMDERSVTAVDRDGSVRTVPTGVLGPSHFARAADRLFVACTGGDAVAAIDPESLELSGRVHVGGEPHELAVRDGLVYAGSRADGTVTAFDPAALEPVATVSVGPDARVQGVAAGPDAVYAVDQANARVARLTPDGVTATAPVGENPYDLLVADDRVFVPGRGDGTVHEFDLALTPASVHETGAGATAVEPAAGDYWVAHRRSATLAALGGQTVELPAPAYELEPLSDDRVLATHYEDAAVSVVDLDAREVERTVAVGANPLGAVVV